MESFITNWNDENYSKIVLPFEFLSVQHTRGWQHFMPCPGDGIPGFSNLPVKSIRPLFGFMAFFRFSVCETDAFVLIWRVVLIWLICVELKVLLKYTFYMENINFLNLKLNLKPECIVSTAYFVSQRSKIVQNKLHIHNRKYLKSYLVGLFWSRF